MLHTKLLLHRVIELLINDNSVNLVPMKSYPSPNKGHTFHEKVDKAFIFNLYENDYPYIAEVFGSSLEALEEDMNIVELSYDQGQLQELKKAVHKIKPVFGFTGLLEHQEKIGLFERQAAMAGNIHAVSHEFEELIKIIREGKKIIEEEYRKLNLLR